MNTTDQRKSPVPSSPSADSISPGGWVVIAVVAVWLIAVASNGSSKKASTRYTPTPAPRWQQATYTTTSPTTYTSLPASTPEPQSLATLESWYARLSAQRQALQPSDTAAIESFNREAARYTAAVTSFRAQRAASLTTYTPSTYTPTTRTASTYTPSTYTPTTRTAGTYTSTTRTPLTYYGEPTTPLYSGRAYPSAGTGRYYDYTYRPPVGEHYVAPHVRSDGAFVDGHYRTDRDDSFWNNYSSAGNLNPHTGRIGTTLPRSSSYSGSTYVRGHVRSNGTYVAPHYRSK